MKKGLVLSLFFGILFIFMILSISAFSLPIDRQIDWSQAGIPGGIPHRTNICTTIDAVTYGNGVTDATSAIQNAINNCPANHVVYIPEGIYRISSSISIRNSNITIRGAGPNKTKIINHGLSSGNFVFAFFGPGGRSASVDIISGFNKGSNTITVSDASLLHIDSNLIGDAVIIDQLNEPGFVTQEGVGTCTWCGREGGNRSMAETVVIINKSGNTLTLSRPLYHNYDSAQLPQVWLVGANPVRYSGIEDLYVGHINGVDGGSFSFARAVHSWLKNVESNNTMFKHVELQWGTYGNEIRDSYLHHAQSFDGNRGYGIGNRGHSANNLFENNILEYLHAGISIGSEGGAGNVVAYNYVYIIRHRQSAWYQSGMGTHGAHAYMNLYEGNVVGKAHFDSYWGSSSHNVVFRNFINRENPATDFEVYNDIIAVIVDSINYYMTFVGNVLGTPGCSGEVEQIPFSTFYNNPVIWKIGYPCCSATGYPTDPKVNQTLIRHGNWECPTNSVQWDSNIPDRNIPASLYLSSKPSWWGNLQWPAFGPDPNNPEILLMGKIPAQLRFEGEILPEPDPTQPTPDIVTLQDMLGAYQQYKRNEVSLMYFLDKLRRWIVFW